MPNINSQLNACKSWGQMNEILGKATTTNEAGRFKVIGYDGTLTTEQIEKKIKTLDMTGPPSPIQRANALDRLKRLSPHSENSSMKAAKEKTFGPPKPAAKPTPPAGGVKLPDIREARPLKQTQVPFPKAAPHAAAQPPARALPAEPPAVVQPPARVLPAKPPAAARPHARALPAKPSATVPKEPPQLRVGEKITKLLQEVAERAHKGDKVAQERMFELYANKAFKDPEKASYWLAMHQDITKEQARFMLIDHFLDNDETVPDALNLLLRLSGEENLRGMYALSVVYHLGIKREDGTFIVHPYIRGAQELRREILEIRMEEARPDSPESSSLMAEHREVQALSAPSIEQNRNWLARRALYLASTGNPKHTQIVTKIKPHFPPAEFIELQFGIDAVKKL